MLRGSCGWQANYCKKYYLALIRRPPNRKGKRVLLGYLGYKNPGLRPGITLSEARSGPHLQHICIDGHTSSSSRISREVLRFFDNRWKDRMSRTSTAKSSLHLPAPDAETSRLDDLTDSPGRSCRNATYLKSR